MLSIGNKSGRRLGAHKLAPATLAFLDETGATTRMARLRGRRLDALSGRGLRMAIGRRPPVEGLRLGCLSAHMAARDLPRAHSPARRHRHPGQPASPQSQRRAGRERADVALMFLSPYSSNFNPIEQVFARAQDASPKGRRRDGECNGNRHRLRHRRIPPA
jgi:hypothetical protein